MFFGTLDRDDLRAITEAIRDGFKGVKISGGGTTTTGGGGTSGSGDIDVSGSQLTGEGIMDAAKKMGANIGNTISSNLNINFGTILDKFNELQGLSQNIYKEFGGTRELTGEINKSLGQSRYEIIQMGGELSDSYQILQQIAETTGRNFLSAADSVDDIFAISKIADIYPRELIKGFDQVGVSMNQVGEQTMGVVNLAAGMGVNVQETTQKVVDNLGKLNLYNFENGVQGLAKMAAKATMFKMDMGNTLKLAEDLLSPEKAIEMAAGLQRLGVASSDLIDPLRLMDLAQNDPEELQNQLIELSKQFTYFDEKTKTVKILPYAQRTLREVGSLVGMTAQELANLGVQAGTAERKLSQLSFPAIKLDEDQKALVSNLAEMNTAGTEYVIKGVFKDEKGNMIEKALDKLTESDMKQIEEYQKQQTRYQDPIEIAKDQLIVSKNIESALKSYQGRTVVEIASSESIERVGNLAAKTAELGMKSAEELYKKVFTEKSISEVIDNKVNDIFKEGANLTEIQKNFGIVLEQVTPKIQKTFEDLAKLDFNSMVEEGKKVFKDFGLNTMESMKTAALEMLKNTASKDIETFLKGIVTDTNETIEKLQSTLGNTSTQAGAAAAMTSTNAPDSKSSNKNEVNETVEIDDGEVEVTNYNETNVTIKSDPKDSVSIDPKGNAFIGTDLLNVKTVMDQFSSMMTNLVDKIGKVEPSTGGVKIDIQTEIGKLKLMVEEKSIELINDQIKNQIVGEKQIELKSEQSKELDQIIKKLEEPLNQLVTFSVDQNKVNVDLIPNTNLLIEELSKQYTKTIELKPEITKFEIDSNINEVKENMLNSIKELQDNLKTENKFEVTDNGSLESINQEFGLLHENFDKVTKMASEFKESLNYEPKNKDILYKSNFPDIKKEIDSLPEKKEINITVNEKWKESFEDSLKDSFEPLVLDVTTKTIDPTKDIPKEVTIDTKISKENLEVFKEENLGPIKDRPLVMEVTIDNTKGTEKLEEFKSEVEKPLTQSIQTSMDDMTKPKLDPITQEIKPQIEQETTLEKVKGFFSKVFTGEKKSIPLDLEVDDKNLTDVENKKRTAEIKYSAVEDLEKNKIEEKKIDVQYLIDDKSYNDILEKFSKPIHFDLIAKTDKKTIDDFKEYASKPSELNLDMKKTEELSNMLKNQTFDKEIVFSAKQEKLEEIYKNITSKNIEQFVDLKITNPDVLKNITELMVNVKYLDTNSKDLLLDEKIKEQFINVNYQTNFENVKKERSLLSEDMAPKFNPDLTKMSDYKVRGQNDITELMKSMTQLNEETGKIEFKPNSERLINDMAMSIGKTTDEVKEMITQVINFESKMNSIKLLDLKIPDSYKEVLGNLTKLNDKGEIVVEMKNETGQKVEKPITSLSTGDIVELMKTMKQEETKPLIGPEPKPIIDPLGLMGLNQTPERPKEYMEYIPRIEPKPFEIPYKQPEIVVETPTLVNEPTRRLEETITNTTTQNNNVNLGGEATITHNIKISGPAGLDTSTFNTAMLDYLKNPTMANQIMLSMSQIQNQYGTAAISKPIGSQASDGYG